ncbi:MAG: FKBP-type peptidyl-prolyl cis-trans isomerase [Ignavibacteriaceae bacterium]
MKTFSGAILGVVLLSFISFAQDSLAVKDTNTTASGLKYIVLTKGNGEKAEPGKEVEVDYTGYLTDGNIFDSSIKRGVPFDFILGEGKVIKGWDEGIALMHSGDKFRLIIPPQLGYGERGAGGVIPPNAELIFDVKLLSVNTPKPSIADTMLETIFDKGIDSAINQYHLLYQTKKDQFNFKEGELNNLGLRLLSAKMNKQAIEIFKLNAETYSNSSNAFNSLAESYFLGGNKELALQNFEKAVELNPKNSYAALMVQKLKAAK